jgi:hypothetical protein
VPGKEAHCADWSVPHNAKTSVITKKKSMVYEMFRKYTGETGGAELLMELKKLVFKISNVKEITKLFTGINRMDKTTKSSKTLKINCKSTIG